MGIFEWNRRNRNNPNKFTVGPGLIAAVIVLVAICLIGHKAGNKLSVTPEVTLRGEQTVSIEVGTQFSDPGATASLGDTDWTSQIETVGTVDGSTVGTYEIEYQVKRFKQTYSATRTVEVYDDEKPTLVLEGDEKITIDQGDTYEEPGYTATDNADGDITEQVEISGEVETAVAGKYTLKYTVTDSSGNKTTQKRVVKVKYKEGAGKSVIYLTFDDGPSADVTEAALDVLAENSVSATFFITDYDDDTKDLVQREISEGHTVGLQTASLDYETIYASTDAYMSSLTELAEAVEEDFDYEPFVIRFPGGSGNTIADTYSEGIIEDLIKLIRKAGYQYQDWNINAGDADGNVTASEIVSTVTANLSKEHINIVRLHDTGDNATTAEALEEIIEYGKQNGYEFRAIDENTIKIHQ